MAGAMAKTKVMAMLFAVLFGVLLAPIFSGSVAIAWTGPDTLAIVPCGDVSSNGDTLEVDTDCEDQFIETDWDRDHADWDRDHADWERDHTDWEKDHADWDSDDAGQYDSGITAEEDNPGITVEEGDAESRISAEADLAKDKTNGTEGTSESGWMGILPPIAGIAIALIVIIAYRFGKAAKKA